MFLKLGVMPVYRQYRVTLVVEYLGWVDLDLGSSPGLLTVAAHQAAGEIYTMSQSSLEK